MEKRLSKTEYLVAYMIIISLACFVGGFFLGVKVMKNNMLEQQAALAEARGQEAERNKQYREQDFVLFYHGVLRPAQGFAEKHARFLSALAGKETEDVEQLAADLRKAAEQAEQELAKSKIPGSSPLLVQARDGYAAGLQAYRDALDRFLDSREEGRAVQFQAFLDEFHDKWLRAQADLYRAISLWEELYVTHKRMPAQAAATYTFAQWESLPFHYRNYLAAEALYQAKRMVSFRPEDLTAHLDNLVYTRQAESLGWKDVNQAVRVLMATNAVRGGDFKAMKDQLYSALEAPQMPIFTE